ncbi:hypothetical protein CNR22_00525 [Sphingobacteriaceae bacterium]|nr:hypothetical protein CNR22_00525 [Sphingobacteriaceae bacterium]
MIKHYLKTSALFLMLHAFLFTKAQIVTPFSSIYQTHQKGGIVFLSNSALGCSADPSTATGTCQVASQELPLLGTTTNNNYTAAYIDIDGDATTFMSSSDALNLPSCSQITKAFLFWGASDNTTPGYNQIKLKVNSGSYQNVVSTSSLANTTGFNSYHCYADVTALLAGATGNATITVADIPSSSVGLANVFGSWNLVVVYKNDAMTMRHLNVYNGLAYVSALSPLINIPISGFLTPAVLTPSFEIGVYSHDGDRGSGTDGISFNGSLLFTPLVDISNPLGDVFNSTATNNGISSSFRNPSVLNTTGYDADIFVPLNTPVLTPYLNNSATTATVQLTTATDNYLAQVLTSAIDSQEPDLRVTLSASDVNGGSLAPGDIVRYRATGNNVGTDNAINSIITCSLDPRVSYIANSTSIVYGSGTGSKTDASSDDEVDYNATTHVLRIRVGSGSSATTGGTITNSSSGVDSTVVTYSVMVSSSCLRLSCNSTFTASAVISGVGAALNHTVTSLSTPGTFTNGCAISGVTSSTVSTSTCAAPSASNSSPACSGGSVTLNASFDPEASYVWSGPNAYTATGMSPTLTAITTSLSGIYTVTLTIPATTCSAVATTSLSVINCPPAATDDFTTTVINTSVSGNAAANDINGIPNGTFAILTQPANGTITMNASTGIYSFTPAANFTGVTTATYQVCNGLPVVCATAAINVTVYPLLVANADIIYTTPSTATSGSLLTNDTGISSTAIYSVSLTQPAVSSGSITFDPATGHYTFTPGASFNGTAQASYTVCNISVNPQQCSSATITINVSNLPVAIDDGAATVINTPVTGDASVNDSGTLGGIYTFGILNPSTGTITGNLLGQYSFTPAAGFTGTTSVTYTLCNLSPPPCSTATITFTVYPLINAVADAIVTTPSTTANGNLLTNDNGITTSASYSVSITQISATTGTLIVDAASGSYTFVPAPTFTGVAQTTYTVCNISVNPQQCSSATIAIAVGNFPMAANDATYTLLNTTVSGDVSTNDTNTLGGTYSFANPSSGTLTTNAATGEYTFTPGNGFTGTLSVSYTLCTAISPPCASAVLTFTVYPLLKANPDLVNAVISSSVTGNLATNDSGLVTGGIYSVVVSPIPATVGTVVVNSSTGQFTFTPFAGFTGSTVTSYTLSQYVGALQIQTSVTTVTFVVSNGGSAIGIAKSIQKVNYPNNGTIELSYRFVVKNYSSTQLVNVSITDDLSATFPSPSTYTIIATPQLKSLPLSQIAVNNQYTGSGNGIDLLVPGASTLAPGRSDTLVFTVAVDPHDVLVFYSNSALGKALLGDSSISDVSVNGINPDPDNDFDPSNNTAATTFSYNLVKIGIAKSAGRSQSVGNGLYEVTFKFTVKNYGSANIYNVLVFDNLDMTFGSPANYTVLGSPTSANGFLIPDNSYNGSANNNLIQYSSQLGFGTTDTLYLRVKYRSLQVRTFSNTATAYAYGIPNGGFTGVDISTNGTNPDLNNNNSARDEDENQPTVFEPSEDFEIPQGFSPNGDGVNDRFEIKGLKEYPNMEVSILNRWGNLVYSKAQYDNSWDGTSKEGLQYGGSDLPEGTYFYIIDLGTDQKPLKGYIYLNRSVR